MGNVHCRSRDVCMLSCTALCNVWLLRHARQVSIMLLLDDPQAQRAADQQSAEAGRPGQQAARRQRPKSYSASDVVAMLAPTTPLMQQQPGPHTM
jgi:hypothetical protein